MFGSEARLRNLLVASDLSTESDRVVEAACRLAVASGADLHVVSAYDAALGGAGSIEPSLPSSVVAEVGTLYPLSSAAFCLVTSNRLARKFASGNLLK